MLWLIGETTVVRLSSHKHLYHRFGVAGIHVMSLSCIVSSTQDRQFSCDLGSDVRCQVRLG